MLIIVVERIKMKKLLMGSILSCMMLFASPILEEGTYSWFKGGSLASLTLTLCEE